MPYFQSLLICFLPTCGTSSSWVTLMKFSNMATIDGAAITWQLTKSDRKRTCEKKKTALKENTQNDQQFQVLHDVTLPGELLHCTSCFSASPSAVWSSPPQTLPRSCSSWRSGGRLRSCTRSASRVGAGRCRRMTTQWETTTQDYFNRDRLRTGVNLHRT